MKLVILIAGWVGFLVLTALALVEQGYWGIVAPHFQSLAGLQVFVDLVIALLLVAIWMILDARQRGVAFWPWLLLTLVLGSIGPLSYLLMRQWQMREHPQQRIA